MERLPTTRPSDDKTYRHDAGLGIMDRPRGQILNDETAIIAVTASCSNG